MSNWDRATKGLTGPTPALWRAMRDRVRRAQGEGDAWVTLPTTAAVRVLDVLESVAESGVEHLAPGYASVQIDAETWTELQEGKP